MFTDRNREKNCVTDANNFLIPVKYREYNKNNIHYFIDYTRAIPKCLSVPRQWR